jgi:hypothetical protein
MKKYTNIPLKKRKRNAERCYRLEENLEERAIKRYIKEKERQCASDFETDKDREVDNTNNEVYKRLKAIEKGVL